MTARSPGAFMLSATFHAAIIAMVVLWGMIVGQQDKVTPRVLELVAGEGDNYGATVAPKLGTPGGVKVDVPTPPTPKIMPEPEPEPTPAPKVIEPEPVPVTAPPKPPPTPVTKAAPTPAPVTPKAEKKQPTFKQKILYSAWAAQAKAKKEAAKERAAEEKKRREEAQRAEAAAAKSGSRVKHIDGEGIAKGVVGGSAENKVGGAGGKALVAEGALLDRYYAMLKQRVNNALDKPPGLSDELAVTVRFLISATGRISGVRVVQSSGSEEFDRAVVVAFSRVSMPEHPEHKGEDLELTFRTKDAGDR